MCLSHKIFGVDNDVEKNLLHLEIVNHAFRKARGELFLDLDIMYFMLVGT